MHVTAVAALVLLALAPPLGAAAAAAIVAHGWLRRPRRPPLVVHRFDDGRWAVPEAGIGEAVLHERTRYTSLWVRLVLSEPGRPPATLLLLRDQLDPEPWRMLQTALRRAAPDGAEKGRTI